MLTGIIGIIACYCYGNSRIPIVPTNVTAGYHLRQQCYLIYLGCYGTKMVRNYGTENFTNVIFLPYRSNPLFMMVSSR